ncbi:hypothetical protein GCM10022254_51010 [Actinomadura meridiana]|uniref:Uncharacterized protein n=1 Tax=Actinomadura meridiana TaxID=559626 RepID=A0ABP8CD03_9ACTN
MLPHWVITWTYLSSVTGEPLDSERVFVQRPLLDDRPVVIGWGNPARWLDVAKPVLKLRAPSTNCVLTRYGAMDLW